MLKTSKMVTEVGMTKCARSVTMGILNQTRHDKSKEIAIVISVEMITF